MPTLLKPKVQPKPSIDELQTALTAVEERLAKASTEKAIAGKELAELPRVAGSASRAEIESDIRIGGDSEKAQQFKRLQELQKRVEELALDIPKLARNVIAAREALWKEQARLCQPEQQKRLLNIVDKVNGIIQEIDDYRNWCRQQGGASHILLHIDVPGKMYGDLVFHQGRWCQNVIDSHLERKATR